jgi:hypothetical protein
MPGPLSPDRDAGLGVGLQRDSDRAPARREFDGVRQKVPHDLAKAAGIPSHVDGSLGLGHGDRDILRRRRAGDLGDRLRDCRLQRYRADVQTQLPGERLRHVEEIAGELRLEPDVPLDGLEAAALGFGVQLAGVDQLQPPQGRH